MGRKERREETLVRVRVLAWHWQASVPYSGEGFWPLAHVNGAFVSARVQTVGLKIPF